jgi:superfamily II DNA or RNA helicase
MDLHLDSSFSNGTGILAGDFNGFVVTYQQVAQKPGLFRRLTENSCIILDEVHHAGDGNPIANPSLEPSVTAERETP